MATQMKFSAAQAGKSKHHHKTTLEPSSSASPLTGASGTTASTSSEGQDGANADEAESAEEDTAAAADEPDAPTPPVVKKQLQNISTPTLSRSSELLAGLRLKSAEADRKKDSEWEAVQKKISELEASGWRPDEEMEGLLDDDDDYNDVDLISDADEEDKGLRFEEERALFDPIQMSAEEQGALARRLSLDSHESAAMDLTVLDDLDFDAGDAPELGSILSLDYDLRREQTGGDLWSQEAQEAPYQQAETQRRVRFEDEIDGSDAGSTDTEQVAETFPDLFMEAHQLGPVYQQMADDDMYLDDGSDAGSCWDFEGDDMQIDHDEDDEDDGSDSLGTSSGYESDGGETTDEEAPPPPSSIRRIAERRASPSDSRRSSTSTPKAKDGKKANAKQNPIQRRTSSPRLPTAGTFMLDPRRPVLLVNGYGSAQRNTIYPAKIRTPAEKRFWQRLRNMYQSQTTSPRTSVQLTPDDEGEFEFAVDSFLGNDEPSNMFFDLLGSLRPDQIMGPPEAFVPFTSVDATGSVTEDQAMQSVSDDEDKDLLAWVDFGSESEDDQDAPEESDSTENAWKTSATFPHISSKAASRRESQSDDLLAHLDRNRGLVGSFRRNQHYAKHIGSLASHPGVRASASEVNAMQAGRRSAGNTPITPLRKKKAGKDVGLRNSPITSPVPGNKKKGPVRGGFGRR